MANVNWGFHRKIWTGVCNTFVPKSDKKIHIQFSVPKCPNIPIFYITDTHFYNSSIKLGSFFFLQLFTSKTSTICWDAKLQALILHNFSWVLWFTFIFIVLDVYFIIKTRKVHFLDFISSYSMIFTLNSIHPMSQTFVI